jgi:hypothetical protein
MTRIWRATSVVSIAILVLDYIYYIAIFAIGFYLLGWLFDYYYNITTHEVDFVAFYLGSIFPTLLTEQFFLHVIFFWSGFAPSIWMWLYVLALSVTRGLVRSEKLVNWLRWGLDVEKNPFRSIGAVAATLAFIVSVAIILVSVEVSRISAAS